MTDYLPLRRRVPKLSDLQQFLRLKPRTGTRLERRLRDAHTIDDLRRLARRRTPAGPFHYVDGGAEDEISMRRAREAFEDVEFNPEILRDISDCDLTTTVLGHPSALPFGFAPTGGTRMMHAAGEKAVAHAAARAGLPYALSSVGTTGVAELAAAVPDGRRWFQIFPLKDRGITRQLMSHAKTHGYDTLIVTVDVPVTGNRLRDLRTGMTFPPQLTLKTFLDASYRVGWWVDFLTTDPFRFTFEDAGSAGNGPVIGLYDVGVGVEYLHWLREKWDGPLVVKGIQTPEDAERVAAIGVDGLILSNHGGRQLDRARPPLHLVPEVSSRVGDQLDVMVDTGIRSGADIIAALASGASFAFVGKAYLYGLMAGGEAGVDRCIEILTNEARRTMQLLGVKRVEDLRPHHVTLLARLSPLTTATHATAHPRALEPEAQERTA